MLVNPAYTGEHAVKSKRKEKFDLERIRRVNNNNGDGANVHELLHELIIRRLQNSGRFHQQSVDTIHQLRQ